MSTLYKTMQYRVRDKRIGRFLDQAAQAVNTVWNHCNGAQRHALKHNQKWPDKRALEASTRASSKILGLPAQTIQCVCHQYIDCRRAAHRSFLRWRGTRSLGWVPFSNQTVVVTGSQIRFNGRNIHMWMHRPLKGAIKAGSFCQDARGRWYCNLIVEYAPCETAGANRVGIDPGITTLATLSTGEKIEHPKFYRTMEAAIKFATRARKRKRIQAIHAKIANSRRDFLNKTTTDLANRFAMIAVGAASAVKQQKRRGKSAADASWGLFRSMLRYKAIARSAQYVEVPEAWTTQTCSSCGSRDAPERPQGIAGLGIREWTCGGCGATHDRDVNAARNILRLGHQALAEGSSP